MSPHSPHRWPAQRALDAERDDRDTPVLGISVAIMLMAVVVLVGWHAHIRAAVQIFPGLNQMQYNTALCFLALGAAGIGLSTSRRLLVLGGGSFAALMGAAVILEYGTGRSFGIDTLFFHPWVTSGEFPGRMAPTAAVSFFLSGVALVILAVASDRTRQLLDAELDSAEPGSDVPHRLCLRDLVRAPVRSRLADGAAYRRGVRGLRHRDAAVCLDACASAGRMDCRRGRPASASAFLPVLLVGASALFPRSRGGWCRSRRSCRSPASPWRPWPCAS